MTALIDAVSMPFSENTSCSAGIVPMTLKGVNEVLSRQQPISTLLRSVDHVKSFMGG